MAELIETQEELFDAADINKADEPQVEQTQEPVAQEVSEEDLPPKYKGKSLDEIVRMHQEAEKRRTGSSRWNAYAKAIDEWDGNPATEPVL